MIQVNITDEFFQVYTSYHENKQDVIKLVSDWIMNMDSTPIYEILINVNPENSKC